MKASITFELGKTVYGQRVILVKEMDDTYTIKKEAGSQRDETDIIRGIPKDVITNMVQATEMTVRKPTKI